MRFESLTPTRLMAALVTAGVIGGASVAALDHIPAHAAGAPVATAVTTAGVPMAPARLLRDHRSATARPWSTSA